MGSVNVFTYLKDKKYIEVTPDAAAPATLIKAVDVDNDEKLISVCENWLEAFGITDKEFHIDKRIK